ncbi:ribonuclease H2 subunit B [Plasmodium brasilianum]|uniref:Ribonuclease H2 subunit B, putative n=2 Tax=Plasmodium (Plasmodium) TaxID=418103 RepID=A0A1A8WBJ6_PLAMA|nr:ribonuclease H2 subunit B, putative [Plasmodium malariae]KAI4835676.1 ribonuclease H2 subunit B [Plasmodium brasilianum]SBS89376.1 ribonuclease H2 subunit B, putative [Plasmodium malariae]SCP02605.1 ribonuclease H2 subunit B, putative [Plasmodium malariae]
MENNRSAFLFHIFCSDINEKEKAENVKVKNYSFIKLPSVPDPSKTVLYYFKQESNELYLLERNYYNPKIETIRNENDKINKSCVSLFINNYTIENDCSFSCYPVDALYLFISIIYYNCTNFTYTTLEDYLDNILKDNEKKKVEATKNVLYIFKKDVNSIKDRLKNVSDELCENGKLYYKPNMKKVQNFYNLKCIILFNFIIEHKIIFPDYSQYIDKDLLEKYITDVNTHPINLIIQKKLKHIDKYKEYKKYVDSYLVQFNNRHYKINGSNLRTFIWLIIKGFMCSSLSEKITPLDILEHLNKIKENEKKKKMQQNETFSKNKKHPSQTPRNQMSIDSFFKKKKIKLK